MQSGFIIVCIGLNSIPLKTHICPEPVKVTLIGNSLCRCNQAKMKSYWIGVGPKSNMTGVLMRRGKLGQKDIDRRKMAMCRQRQRLELCCHKSRSTKDCWQLLEAKRGKKGFFPGVFGGNRALTIPWFQTSGLQDFEIINFCCFKPPVCHLFRQPQETNTQSLLGGDWMS